MKQTICHSQMPKFEKNQSNTTPFLHQPPTAANTIQYKSKSGLVRASIAAIICSVSIISGLFSCTVDQHATAAQVEHIVKAGVKP
jgi:K+ transporter